MKLWTKKDQKHILGKNRAKISSISSAKDIPRKAKHVLFFEWIPMPCVIIIVL